MAIDDGLLAGVTTLIGASVFSTGFLSTRIHTALASASRRAQEVDDKLLDLSEAVVDERRLALERTELQEAVQDQFPQLVLGANGAFAAGVVALSAVSAAEATSRGDGLALATLVLTELGVVGIGLVDYRRANRTLRQRLARTKSSRVEAAEERLFTVAHGESSADRWSQLREVERTARALREETIGEFPAATGLVVMSSIARRWRPDINQIHTVSRHLVPVDESPLPRQIREEVHESRADDDLHELRAEEDAWEEQLQRLIALEPQRQRWRQARIRLLECQERWPEAAVSWIDWQALLWKAGVDWEDGRFVIRPEGHPAMLVAALTELEARGELSSQIAEFAARELPAENEDDAEYWVEKVARALSSERPMGWLHTESFLRWLKTDDKYPVSLIARLEAELVAPGREAFEGSLRR